MMKKYPGLKIVGVHNGYFDEKEEKKIIQDIKKKAPSILLVGLGAPKQEKWIYDNIRLVGAKVAIGVGGSFDVMAGNVKRAPKWMQMLAMEWFYRFLMEPKRMFRRYFVDDVKFFWYFGRQLLGIYRNPFKD